ncbi:hypothetical protein C8J57DRAFT_1252181 [Mycena rebaudengoi]|nr:hypothetical protein C8J57DRAFT_1252181 [Mycena rebaudengoi]
MCYNISHNFWTTLQDRLGHNKTVLLICKGSQRAGNEKKFFFSLGCVIIFENAQFVAGDPDEVQKRSQASEFIGKRIVVERSQIILIIEGCVLVTWSVFSLRSRTASSAGRAHGDVAKKKEQDTNLVDFFLPAPPSGK